jgi:hypothetical protein
MLNFNYDVITQAVWNFTSDATANWTVNIRGDGSNSLDSIMDVGESQTSCSYYFSRCNCILQHSC